MTQRLAADVGMRPGAAFANGTEWDAWSAYWCMECRHEPACPILLAALTQPDLTPVPWVDAVTGALGPRRYVCTEFRREPER